MECPASTKRRTVEFPIRAVRFPDLCHVLRQLYGGEIIRGEVLDVTTDVETAAWFAVIRVAGLDDPVIVPANEIRQVE
jgi:hypothetical protein